VLHLDHNELESLPYGLFYMPQLPPYGCHAQALVLDFYNLGRIAGGIGAFKQLQVRLHSAVLLCAAAHTVAAAAQLRKQLHSCSTYRVRWVSPADRGQPWVQCV
jgi:hypothetical protein